MNTIILNKPATQEELNALIVEFKSVVGNDEQAMDKKRDLIIELFRKSNGRG